MESGAVVVDGAVSKIQMHIPGNEPRTYMYATGSSPIPLQLAW